MKFYARGKGRLSLVQPANRDFLAARLSGVVSHTTEQLAARVVVDDRQH